MPNLVQVIKKAAMDAVEASKPCRFVYGDVVSTDPLQIRIEQKITLSKEFLIIPERFTNHVIELSLDGVNMTKYTWHNTLKANETVVLLQQKGGQRYLIIDRMVTK